MHNASPHEPSRRVEKKWSLISLCRKGVQALSSFTGVELPSVQSYAELARYTQAKAQTRDLPLLSHNTTKKTICRQGNDSTCRFVL